MRSFPASTSRRASSCGEGMETAGAAGRARRRRVSVKAWVMPTDSFSMSSSLLGNWREPVSREGRELMLLDGDPRRCLLHLSGLGAEEILQDLDAALRALGDGGGGVDFHDLLPVPERLLEDLSIREGHSHVVVRFLIRRLDLERLAVHRGRLGDLSLG